MNEVVGEEAEVGQPGLLGQARRGVHPQPVQAEVEPEPQHVGHVGADAGMVPVQVRLGRGEQVEVPLARRAVRLGHPGPGRATEGTDPVVRRLLAVLAPAVAEVVAGPFVAARRGGQGGPEPGVLVRGVVGDEVDDHLQAQGVRVVDQPAGVLQGAEQRLDVGVVGDVVAAVLHRRRVPRGEPEAVHAQVAQVGQPGAYAGQVADPVAVAVGEAAQVDLVHHRIAPPGSSRLGHAGTIAARSGDGFDPHPPRCDQRGRHPPPAGGGEPAGDGRRHQRFQLARQVSGQQVGVALDVGGGVDPDRVDHPALGRSGGRWAQRLQLDHGAVLENVDHPVILADREPRRCGPTPRAAPRSAPGASARSPPAVSRRRAGIRPRSSGSKGCSSTAACTLTCTAMAADDAGMPVTATEVGDPA